MEKKRTSETSTDLRGDAVVEISGELANCSPTCSLSMSRRRISTGTSVARISEITTSCSMSMVLKSSR